MADTEQVTQPTQPTAPLPKETDGTMEQGRIASDTDNNLAVMSAAAYGDSDAQNRLAKEGFKVDDRFSSDKYVTYTKDGKAYIAFKGTDLTDPQDVYTDMMIAVGDEKNTALFKEGARNARQVIRTYGKDNTTFTGHSLGGTIALYANSETGAPAVTFATGVGLGMVAKAAKEAFQASVFRRKIKSNTKIYTVHRDAVSMLAPYTSAKTIYLPQSADSSHTLANFTDYKRFNKAEAPKATGRAKRNTKRDDEEEPFLFNL